MASVFQVFDLNHEVAQGNKVVHEKKRRFSHAGSGLEAPRNSLDIPLQATETWGPRSFTVPEDVPFGYELHKSHLSAIATRSNAKEGALMRSSMAAVPHAAFSGESESKRRAPSVVAQLMGLNDLPDDFLPLAPRKSCHELRSYIEASHLPYKENRPFLFRQQSQGSLAPASMWPPPLPKTMCHIHALSQDNEGEERESPVKLLPFREHPQEKQLQEFKKKFGAQFCIQSQNHHVHPLPVEFKYMNHQQLEEKKAQKMRATLDQARLSIAHGNSSNPNCQLSPGKFQESKEFREAMEYLQCNKELFFEFLQQQKPNTVFSHQPLEPGPWELTEHLAQLKPLKKARGQQEQSPSSAGTERKKEAFSPRAFARQFLESLRRHNSKLRQAKTAPGNEPKISVASHHELSRCSSGRTRSTIVEADLSDSHVTAPKAPISLKMSSNLTRKSGDGRDCVQESAQLLIEEVKERTKQWNRDQARDEMRYAKQVQGSSKEPKEVSQEIARLAQEAAASFASLGSSSSRYEVSLTRSTTTGKRVTIDREIHTQATSSEISACNNGEWILTPTLKEQQVSSSCTTSLLNSPHLIQRHDPTVTSKLTKTQMIEKAKAIFPDPVDVASLMSKVVSVDPKSGEMVEAKCIQESPQPGSLSSNQTIDNFKSIVSSENFVAGKTALSKSCRVDVANSTNLNYPNTVMEMEMGNDCPGWKGCSRDQAKESSPRDAMPTKCCSVSNALVSSAHKQETLSGDGSSKKPMSSLGAQQKRNQKISGKALLQSPKAASAKNTRGQTVEGRRGPLLLAKTKTCNIVDECNSVKKHRISYHDPSPVAPDIVQLAEACVVYNSVLFDADQVDDGGSSQDKFCSSSMEANNAKASATRAPFQRPPFRDKSNGAGAAGVCICGQNFLDDLSQAMMPQALAECGHAAIPSTQNQVEPQKQSRTQERPWLMSMDVEGDDFTFDKNEQPSPISVLESPFKEESLGALESKEITNDLQGLRNQLHFLKVDGSDRPRAALVKNALPLRDLEFAEAFSATAIPSRVNGSTSSDASLRESLNNRSQETTTKSHMIDNFLPTSPEVCQRPSFRNTLCNMGWKDDLTYMYNMLHSSGVTDNTASIVSRWHSLACPLRKSIFERLEACYPSSKRESSNRWVLFNAINEILFRKLDADHNLHPFLALKSSSPPIGKKIAKEIWLELYNQTFNLQHRDLHDDYVEMLVARDVTNSQTWSSLHLDIDSIRVDIEHAIFNDLIEEVVQNLISSYSTLSLEKHMLEDTTKVYTALLDI